ncbi:hypothetical protein JCM21900_001911 [Sporobolomyces salmonicolor]
MEALQLKTARLCVEAFAAKDLDTANSHLSDRDDLTWEIRPGSLGGSWMEGERRGKTQVSELWRRDRNEVCQAIKNLAMKNVVQSKDAIAFRLTYERVAPTPVESEPMASEGELAFFLEFEPDTDKILKGIKFVDSAHILGRTT